MSTPDTRFNSPFRERPQVLEVQQDKQRDYFTFIFLKITL
jgi:hypothetical protein